MSPRSSVLWAIVLAVAAPPLVAAEERPPGTRFAIAIEDGDGDAVEALIKEGHGPDTPIPYGAHFTTPLIKSAGQGDVDLVSLLLEHGASIDGTNSSGQTALMEAATRGWDDIIARLVVSEADVNVVDSRHNSALSGAVLGNRTEIAVTLIKAGARLDHAVYGSTPIHLAASAGHADMVEALVKAGAKVDCVCKGEHCGDTPLVLAAFMGKTDTVAMLIKLGADVNKRGTSGSPLEVAVGHKHDDVASMLREAGAK